MNLDWRVLCWVVLNLTSYHSLSLHQWWTRCLSLRSQLRCHWYCKRNIASKSFPIKVATETHTATVFKPNRRQMFSSYSSPGCTICSPVGINITGNNKTAKEHVWEWRKDMLSGAKITKGRMTGRRTTRQWLAQIELAVLFQSCFLRASFGGSTWTWIACGCKSTSGWTSDSNDNERDWSKVYFFLTLSGRLLTHSGHLALKPCNDGDCCISKRHVETKSCYELWLKNGESGLHRNWGPHTHIEPRAAKKPLLHSSAKTCTSLRDFASPSCP